MSGEVFYFKQYVLLKYMYCLLFENNAFLKNISSNLTNFIDFFNFITICDIDTISIEDKKFYHETLNFKVLIDELNNKHGFLLLESNRPHNFPSQINELENFEFFNDDVLFKKQKDKFRNKNYFEDFINITLNEYLSLQRKWVILKLTYHLNLDQRTKNTLKKINAKNFKDVILTDFHDLVIVSGCGSKTLQQIEYFKKTILSEKPIFLLSFFDMDFSYQNLQDNSLYQQFISQNVFLSQSHKKFILKYTKNFYDIKNISAVSSDKTLKSFFKQSINLLKWGKNCLYKSLTPIYPISSEKNEEEIIQNPYNINDKILINLIRSFTVGNQKFDIHYFFFLSERSKKLLKVMNISNLDNLLSIKLDDLVYYKQKVNGIGNKTIQDIFIFIQYLAKLLQKNKNELYEIPKEIKIKSILEKIKLFVNSLASEDKKLVEFRYMYRYSLEEIGVKTNLSRERVRQLLSPILSNLHYYIKSDLIFFIEKELVRKKIVLINNNGSLEENMLEDLLKKFYNFNAILSTYYTNLPDRKIDEYLCTLLEHIYSIGIPCPVKEVLSFLADNIIPLTIFEVFTKKFKVKIYMENIVNIGKLSLKKIFELILKRKNKCYHLNELNDIYYSLSGEMLNPHYTESVLLKNSNILLVDKGTFGLKNQIFSMIGYDKISFIIEECYQILSKLGHISDTVFLLEKLNIENNNLQLTPYLLKSILLTDKRFVGGRKFEIWLEKFFIEERKIYKKIIEEILNNSGDSLHVKEIHSKIFDLYKRNIPVQTLEQILGNNDIFIRVNPHTFSLLKNINLTANDLIFIKSFTKDLIQSNSAPLSINYILNELLKCNIKYNILNRFSLKHILKRSNEFIFWKNNIIAIDSILPKHIYDMNSYVIYFLKNKGKPVNKSFFYDKMKELVRDNIESLLQRIIKEEPRIKEIGNLLILEEFNVDHNAIDIGLNIEI